MSSGVKGSRLSVRGLRLGCIGRQGLWLTIIIPLHRVGGSRETPVRPVPFQAPELFLQRAETIPSSWIIAKKWKPETSQCLMFEKRT